MNIIKATTVVLAGTMICSCSLTKKTSKKDAPFTKLESGIEYKIVDDVKGKDHPQEGDYVEIFIQTLFEDSLIFDSREQTNGKPVAFPVREPAFHGDLTECFSLLTPGDSAIFLVPVDTLKAAGQNIQPWMETGKKIMYTIKLESVKTLEQLKKEQLEAAGRQPKEDDSLMNVYFKQHDLHPQKTESGIYYVITKKGEGKKPIPGQTVKVMYTGKLLNGKVFDSNIDPQFGHTDPLSFALGRGRVIQGWDEGIGLLNKGAKATLFIPSHLAYGENPPTAKIPPNSVLVFDVELLDYQ